MRTLLTLASGWGVMYVIFFALGDRISDGLAAWLWGWDRSAAYRPGMVALVHVTDVVALSNNKLCRDLLWLCALGWLVARMNRPHAAPMLFVHAGSIVLGLILSALIIEVLTLRNGSVPTPHGLYLSFSGVAVPMALPVSC